jgi:hypothetical protein
MQFEKIREKMTSYIKQKSIEIYAHL